MPIIRRPSKKISKYENQNHSIHTSLGAKIARKGAQCLVYVKSPGATAVLLPCSQISDSRSQIEIGSISMIRCPFKPPEIDGCEWQNNGVEIEVFPAIGAHKNKRPQQSPEPDVDRESPVLETEFTQMRTNLPSVYKVQRP